VCYSSRTDREKDKGKQPVGFVSDQPKRTMNVNELYPSKYLKADDIGEKQPVVVISKVELEKLPDGTSKPSLSFEKCKKKLMLNKTNANQVTKLYGPDTTKWIGKPITLKVMEVQFKDELVNAIRISGNKPAAAPSVDELNEELETATEAEKTVAAEDIF